MLRLGSNILPAICVKLVDARKIYFHLRANDILLKAGNMPQRLTSERKGVYK